MSLKIAIQMDAPQSLRFATDSTIRLGIEALSRGHTLWYYTPDKLTYDAGDIIATAQPIVFHNNPDHFFDAGESTELDLKKMDVVLMRQDPPFNMNYISATYLLEQLTPHTLVSNDPASVRNLPEKIFPTLFKQYMPPTLITSDAQEIAAFRKEYKDIVVKPLYGYAGHSVVHVKPEADLSNTLQADFGGITEPLMVQPFLPEVKTGDRRIILIDGEIGGIMARIPAEDDFRANFRVGGHAEPATLTKGQKEICETLKPALQKHGIIFAGIDVIGDYLTEINITSPTGLPAMNRLNGTKLEAAIWDAIEKKL